MQSIMKSEYVTFDELSEESKDFTIKVKVIDKSRIKDSEDKTVTFQPIYFMDEKGQRMKLTLFGNQIRAHDEAIEYNGEYEISNLKVKELPKKYRGVKDDFPLQLTLTRYTRISSIDPDSGRPIPHYRSLAALPKYQDPNEKYDVVGVIIYVEPEPRLVDTLYGQSYVRHIVITDQSQYHSLTISAWNDLSGSASDEINKWSEKFLVVGFTALRIKTNPGLQLSTTMSTRFILDPKGDRPNALREWTSLNRQIVQDRQARVLQIRLPSGEESINTIQELIERNAQTTLFEERHWINATVHNASLDKLRLYIGCPDCGRKTYALEGQSFPCLSESCRGKQQIATLRAAMNFEAVDATGTIELTTFAKTCEEMLRKTTEELRLIKYTKNEDEFGMILQKLQTSPVYFKLGPSQALMTRGALQWMLKNVEHIDKVHTKAKKSGPATSDETPDSYLNAEQDSADTEMLQCVEGSIDLSLQHDQTPDSKAAAKGKQTMIPSEPQIFPSPRTKGIAICEPAESPIQKNTVFVSKHQTPTLQNTPFSFPDPSLANLQNHPISEETPIPLEPSPQNTRPMSHIEEIVSIQSETASTNKKSSKTKVTPETPLLTAEKRSVTHKVKQTARKKLRFESSQECSDDKQQQVDDPSLSKVSASTTRKQHIEQENIPSSIQPDVQE